MNRFAALPLFLFAATAAVRAQEPVVRTYGLHDVLAPAPDAFLVPVGPALPGEDSREYTGSGGFRMKQPHRPMQLGREPLLKWLRGMWGDDVTAAGEVSGDVLTLRAAPGTHARVQDLLSVLQGVTGSTLKMRVHVLPAGVDGQESALLDTQAVAELLEAHPAVRSHALNLRADMPGFLESGRAAYMLRDYDVEVAQRASISDPKTDVVFLGDRLGVVATPMADGRFLLRWGWTSARGELPFPRRSLTGKGLGSVDLPVVDSAEILGTTALAPGEGVLVSGAVEPVLLVLEEAHTSPLVTGSVAAVPLGPLAVPPLLAAGPTRLVTRPGVDEILGWSWSEKSLPDLYAVLALHLGTDFGEQLDLTVLGTHAIATSQGLAQRVEALARERAEAVAVHDLQFKAGTLTREDADAPADVLAGRTDRTARAVTLADQAFAVESWTEKAFVRDYEVEIAQRSAVANPVIGFAFDGWAVRGKVHRTDGAPPTLSGSFQWSRVPPTAPRDTGIEELGAIEFPEVCYTEAELRTSLRPGAWQVLHRGADPLDPDDKVLVLLARAR